MKSGIPQPIKYIGLDLTKVIIQNNTKNPNTLINAAHDGDAEAIETLLNAKADVNSANIDGITPLHIAVFHGHTGVVDKLIKAQADVYAKNKYGTTPLHIAADKGNAEAIKLLLEANANVNSANIDGVTPLDIAADKGNAEAIKLLLEANADVNSANIDGETPLHTAAYIGNAKAIEALLNAKADVNSANINGVTPLHIAANNRDAITIETLLNANADVNLTTKDGVTALHFAVKNSNTKVVDQHIKKQADVYAKSKYGNAKVVDQLIKKQADVNAKNKYGQTPLSISLHSGVLSRRLLLAGADLIKPENEVERNQLIQALKTINIEHLSPTELSNIKQSGCYSLIKLLQLKGKNREENETLDQKNENLFREIFSHNGIKIESLKSPILLEIMESGDLTPIQKIDIFHNSAQNPDREYIVGEKPQSSPSGNITGGLLDKLGGVAPYHKP